MNRFVILLGGDLTPTPRLLAQVTGARVIAADAGIRHASVLGVTPELWIGDFDSVDAAMEAQFAGIPTRRFSPDKDQTDGELAVEVALGLGADTILLAGAFGGPRTDHAFLHLAMTLRLAGRGVDTMLSSGSQEAVRLTPGGRDFDYADGALFSILGFSELTGLTVTGARWPLDSVTVPFGSSLTVSNRVRGRLSVDLVSGEALLLAHPQAGA